MNLARRLGIGLVALASLAACTSTSSSPPASAADGALSKAVSEASAYTHLEALQKIADQNGGTRATPSPGYDASVEYVAKVLRDAGYEVSTPAFPEPSDEDSGSGSDDSHKRQARAGSYRNVIAQTRTGDPNHVVFLGAHLDSVPEGPGINDDGSGVAALLEIALRLGSSPDTRNAVRFAFWGMEEADMVGSNHYVKALSSQHQRQILAYMNVDMVASGESGEVFDRCYHQACDNLANINRKALDHNVRALAAATEYFAAYTGNLASE